MRQRIRLLSILEAATVTSPAQCVLEACRVARTLDHRVELVPHLATYFRGATLDNDFSLAVQQEGLPLTGFAERRALDVRVIDQLRRLVAQFDPDVIETASVKSHFLVRLSGVARHRPWVAFHHGYTFTDRKMRLYNQLDYWSLRRPDRVVTVSRAFQQQLIERRVAPSRIVLLQNAMDPDWGRGLTDDARHSLRDSLGVKSGERIVLGVGRFSFEKAFPDLVQAFAHLRRTHPDLPAKLLILGDGPERAAIEAEIARHSLQHLVRLPGHRTDVKPYYAIADALAISSLSEGAPFALLEAMAAGVPVASTAVGGIPELVEDQQSALLTPARQPEMLAESLARLLTQPELAGRLAAQARALIRQRHSPEARTRALLDLYQDVITLKNRR
jgi:glycosyltransferase involved in cell wall biosynthesis